MFVSTVSPSALSSPIGSFRKPPAFTRSRIAGQDLLLAGRPGEVALAGGLADPGVGEGLLAVQVVAAGGDREAVREAVLVVGRVAEAVGDVDVDPAEACRRR